MKGKEDMNERITKEEMLEQQIKELEGRNINLGIENAHLVGIIKGISYALDKDFRELFNDNYNEQR